MFEDPDCVPFPIDADIEYANGVRVERVEPETWLCPHGTLLHAQTGTEAANLCAHECEGAGAYDLHDPKGPRFHSVHADIWDQREGK
jgi:hypothetical protein